MTKRIPDDEELVTAPPQQAESSGIRPAIRVSPDGIQKTISDAQKKRSSRRGGSRAKNIASALSDSEDAKPFGLSLAAKFSIPICIFIACIIGGWGLWIGRNMEKVMSSDIENTGVIAMKFLAERGEEILSAYQAKPGSWPLLARLVEENELEEKFGPGTTKLLQEYDTMQTGSRRLPAEKVEKSPVYQRSQEVMAYIQEKAVLQAVLRSLLENGKAEDNEILDAIIYNQDNAILASARPLSQGLELKDDSQPSPSYLADLGTKRDGTRIEQFKVGLDGNPKSCFYFTKPLSLPATTGGLVRGSAVLILSAHRLDAQKAWLQTEMSIVGVFAVIFAAIICYFIAWYLIRPFHVLVKDIACVARGDLNHETIMQSKDEIGALALRFNDMTRRLREAHDAEKEQIRMEDELDLAQEIQTSLLPSKIPHIKGFDVYAIYQPAKEVSGDYFDLFPIDSEHLGVIVADVSGKGIPGSMVMATTRAILHFIATENLSARDTLARTNQVLSADIRRGMFVTALYAVINVRKSEMLLASAGHNPLAIYRAATKDLELINPGGIALGFDKGELFNRNIKETKLSLAPGDRAVFYTDGIVEAMSEQNEEYTSERFYEFIRANSDLSSKNFVENLLADVAAHEGDAEQHDDITIVTFRKEGGAA
ncbi:MAG: SpoIIE family protein phosphatase [Planctomycetes bacterium]|nr:SpoIIE family protein phosphatase [Planctomycetota bacterium]